MLKFSDSSIRNVIDISKNHIENFQLDSTEGTKRTKAKFRTMAISQRNSYVRKKIEEFSDLKLKVIDELKNRYNQLMPVENESFKKLDSYSEKLFKLVNLKSCMSDSFKLGLDFYVAKISNETSLEEFISIIDDFIKKFSEYGIELSIKDFNYTMFTEQFMEIYFNNSSFDKLREVFESIYFKCPDIKLQMKLNFSFIISKYSNKLSNVVKKIVKNMSDELKVDDNNYFDNYLNVRIDLGTKMAQDPYINTKLFLDGKYKIDDFLDSSPMKAKYYELFIEGSFDGFDNIVKDRYNNSLLDLYLTINELKKYYTYEFIINDLLEKYKNKDNVKGEITAKKKEIDKNEKLRIKYYHEYLKASGKGLFAIKNENKKKDAMLKINETVKNLNKLNDEYKDLTLTSNLNTLNESCTIYDLFLISLTSFTFLEKCFEGKEEFVGELSDIVHDYLRFIYNPVNAFIRKINVLTEYDIANIITEKFKILDLTLTDTMLTNDGIDATIDSLQTINLIQNVDKSSISFDQIKVLCDMKKIVDLYKEGEE